MKKFSLILFNAFEHSVASVAKGTDDGKIVYKVNAEKSKITWTGKKVIGQHTGNILVDNGEVRFDGQSLVMVNVKMDMNSITSTDLTNEEWNQKLVGHLKSDDFFSVEKHPEASFEATGFKTSAGEAQFIVTGQLTIKGITHEISFPATVKLDNGQLKANGTARINRTKYEIKYGSGSFFKGLGDNMIHDDFKIEFDLFATSESV